MSGKSTAQRLWPPEKVQNRAVVGAPGGLLRVRGSWSHLGLSVGACAVGDVTDGEAGAGGGEEGAQDGEGSVAHSLSGKALTLFFPKMQIQNKAKEEKKKHLKARQLNPYQPLHQVGGPLPWRRGCCKVPLEPVEGHQDILVGGRAPWGVASGYPAP